MPQPIVTWCDSAGTDISATTVDYGVVDAGNDSAIIQLQVWNNKGGVSPVSPMVNCTFTTKDQAGNDTGAVVTGQWLKVACRSNGGAEATGNPSIAVGGTQGATLPGGLTGVETPIRGWTQAAGTIAGAINDGNPLTTATKPNYATIDTLVHIPLGTIAAVQEFAFRVNFQYT